MKEFIVEFNLKPDAANKVIELFEQKGPNRLSGVTFRNAWIGTRSNKIFVVCESDEESFVEKASQSWSAFGDFTIHAVVNYERY